MPGPDVEVGVGRVAVLGPAGADLRGGLVERQRNDRRCLELLRGRLPRLEPPAGKELLRERLERDSLLLGLAGDVLEDGDGGVDATALLEEGADSAAGALRGDEDDVNVGGDLDLGEVLEDGREAVGEVESLW